MIASTWPTDLLRIGDLTCVSVADLLDLPPEQAVILALATARRGEGP